MFHLFKTKNPYEQKANDVYGKALSHVRQSSFYEEYEVPDTLDGRFDLLILHAFLVVNRMNAEDEQGHDFNQELFDAMFADIDQTLREIGIGDTGIPKHMRRMMRGFNGRMHTYAEALDSEKSLQQSLSRNLYGTHEDVSDQVLSKMAVYVLDNVSLLEKLSGEQVMNGQFSFKAP